ncbi:hypothetical protein [Chryseobacterium sp.]|uniref:hypothetical protein n=1 Tax=Chryseobacterium sp. TaxID=1871047 RepID=UPI00289D74A1|nr:hypothetical protein [Chryseobacterium sp.]
MKTKIINYIISCILLVYYCISIATTYSLIIVNKGGWYLGEWVINYQDGGFKRRGFFGSIFIFINEITKINLENIVFGFLFVVYTLFFYLLIKLLWKEKNNLLVIALILLPAGFGMMMKDPSIASKKEIIFFLFYLFYITSIQYKMVIKDYIISIFIIVAILHHEAAFFYLPFVGLAYFMKNEGTTFSKLKKMVIYQLLPSTVLMLLLFKFGININTQNSVEFLKNHGLVFNELGIYEYDTNYDVIGYYKANAYSYQTYLISIALGAFAFYIYCKMNAVKINALFILSQIVFLVPLFYLAIDWGRWVNIFFSLLTIFIVTEQKSILTRKQEIFTIILILFNFSWKMMLKEIGFITFPAIDDLIKKIYYVLFFKMQKIFF